MLSVSTSNLERLEVAMHNAVILTMSDTLHQLVHEDLRRTQIPKSFMAYSLPLHPFTLRKAWRPGGNFERSEACS